MTPIFYAPDLDTAWSVNPGALDSVNYLAPLQDGSYATTGVTGLFTPASADVLSVRTFRKVDGTVRFLVFRTQNIDEYSNSWVRTNQGTSYNASTTQWSAAAFGNQIIATNYYDAPQSSTGTTFTALSGSPPKAKYVAANAGFVMFANTDDGTNQYGDNLWWSGIQNPTTWTPSIATQCGNYRLLDAPGPVTALHAFRDGFVAFKDNAIFVGEYIGPPFVWSWRMVSNKVGCSAPKSVVECDGKLYFVHLSGVYEFDGQTLRNVGIPVFRSMMASMGIMKTANTRGVTTLPTNVGSVSDINSCADDFDGVVWIMTQVLGGGSTYIPSIWGFNVRSQKWGRYSSVSTSEWGLKPQVLAKISYADMQAFSSTLGNQRFILANNGTVNSVQAVTYPSAVPSTGYGFALFKTGVMGMKERSGTTIRVWPRSVYPSDASPWDSSSTMQGYTTEDHNVTSPGNATLSYNSELQCLDGRVSSKYAALTVVLGSQKSVCVGGVDIEQATQPSRR